MTHGVSQARIARSARGQDGAGGGKAAGGPPLSAAGFGPRWRRLVLRRGIGEPGVPAEAGGAVDPGLGAAGGGVGAGPEGGPAPPLFSPLLGLPGPTAGAPDPP